MAKKNPGTERYVLTVRFTATPQTARRLARAVVRLLPGKVRPTSYIRLTHGEVEPRTVQKLDLELDGGEV